MRKLLVVLMALGMSLGLWGGNAADASRDYTKHFVVYLIEGGEIEVHVQEGWVLRYPSRTRAILSSQDGERRTVFYGVKAIVGPCAVECP